MNLDRLAALLVRLIGFLFLADAVVSSTYIPYHMANIAVANSRGWTLRLRSCFKANTRAS